jgi:hypothetical protein
MTKTQEALEIAGALAWGLLNLAALFVPVGLVFAFIFGGIDIASRVGG